MKHIAVIGAGTMGNGIAHTFAQSGFTVKLIDISEKSLEKGMATIAANLDRMVAKGTISEEDKHKTIGNIITYTYAPGFTEYHMLKALQVNKEKKKGLCGYVMMFKKVRAENTETTKAH